MVIIAIVINLLAFVIIIMSNLSATFVGGAVLLIMFVLALALIGLIRILLGSQLGAFSSVLLFTATLVPLMNLVALARINHLATKDLRASGYKVGLLGVKSGYVA